ncbi:MAG TPA: M48 family metallopeptidase [Paucimonas sp.]|nr:M48 family metallopeptidase [Paucimonas sp.]
MGIPAYYFDGATSRRHRVELSVQAGVAAISGDVQRQAALSELRVSERGRNAPRKVTFPDGAYLEVLDNAALSALLAETGHRDSFVVRMQQSWRLTAAALALTIAVLALGYLHGLPALSRAIAFSLPAKAEQAIGGEVLEFLDKHLLAPTALDAARRTAIETRFRALVPPRADAPPYELVFRKSKIGPNAFALPSGQIVLTDEIVTLLGDDDAVMGVLAHELGHLHERHLLRRMIESTAIGIAATALLGDVSAVIANIPTLMLDLKYSRDAEREADDYAVAMLRANAIPETKLALVFEKLGGKSGEPPPYLSSHPLSSERIARIGGKAGR